MQKKRNQKGVTIVEYAIMLALIAIAIAVAAPNITSMQVVGGNAQIDFTSEPTDTPDLFKLQSSAIVNGSYTNVSPPATITNLAPGSFRAVQPASGNVQFYRIKK